MPQQKKEDQLAFVCVVMISGFLCWSNLNFKTTSSNGKSCKKVGYRNSDATLIMHRWIQEALLN